MIGGCESARVARAPPGLLRPFKTTPLVSLAGNPARPLACPSSHLRSPRGVLGLIFLFFCFFFTSYPRFFRKLLQELRLNGECSESNKFMVQALVLDQADNHNTAVAVVSSLVASLGFGFLFRFRFRFVRGLVFCLGFSLYVFWFWFWFF